MGLGDTPIIMNIVVNKMCNNIRFWHRSDKILGDTLEVLGELVSSYSSSKALLSLETVNFLVHNHVGAHFPFLGYDNDNKYRVTFYSTLSRLVFSSSEDQLNSFDTFIAPNITILAQLSQHTNLRDASIRLAIIGALRDLRGITSSTFNKRTYNLLFDSLYPESFPLLIRIAETWFDDPVVMTALLKFINVIIPKISNFALQVFLSTSLFLSLSLFDIISTSSICCLLFFVRNWCSTRDSE